MKYKQIGIEKDKQRLANELKTINNQTLINFYLQRLDVKKSFIKDAIEKEIKNRLEKEFSMLWKNQPIKDIPMQRLLDQHNLC
jgi:translation elongation factor EF-G